MNGYGYQIIGHEKIVLDQIENPTEIKLEKRRIEIIHGAVVERFKLEKKQTLRVILMKRISENTIFTLGFMEDPKKMVLNGKIESVILTSADGIKAILKVIFKN